MLPISAGGCFDEALGIWICASATATADPRPALFLDRDGVIVEDPGYLCRPGDLRMIPGAAQVIGSANGRGIPVVEVTNQAGIGRGYYTWKEFAAGSSRSPNRTARVAPPSKEEPRPPGLFPFARGCVSQGSA